MILKQLIDCLNKRSWINCLKSRNGKKAYFKKNQAHSPVKTSRKRKMHKVRRMFSEKFLFEKSSNLRSTFGETFHRKSQVQIQFQSILICLDFVEWVFEPFTGFLFSWNLIFCLRKGLQIFFLVKSIACVKFKVKFRYMQCTRRFPFKVIKFPKLRGFTWKSSAYWLIRFYNLFITRPRNYLIFLFVCFFSFFAHILHFKCFVWLSPDFSIFWLEIACKIWATTGILSNF